MSIRYGLEIRAATNIEANDLAELVSLAGYHISPGDLSTRLNNMGHGKGAVLVALQWGPPCGLVVLHWYQTLTAAQPTAQITTLFVVPDERRKGIGRMLLKAASQAARVAGCGALEMVAGENATELHEFCHSTGFTGQGTHFVRTLRKKMLNLPELDRQRSWRTSLSPGNHFPFGYRTGAGQNGCLKHKAL